MSQHQEGPPFVSRVGPLSVNLPRTIGYYGGLALAVTFDFVAPPLAIFIALVPMVKLIKRKNATKWERAIAAVLEGAGKPVGADAESTVRPEWEVEEERRTAERASETAALVLPSDPHDP